MPQGMIRPLLVILVSLAAGLAAAQEPSAQLRLLPGWRMENGHHMAGLEIRLPSGWKTYWRRPGEAGIPPDFDWSGSANMADVRIHWPVPHVFRQAGLRSIGYGEGVVLPVEVVPARPGQPVSLSLRAEMGMCDDICVPVSAAARATLPAAPARPDARIRAALADRPLTAAESGARVECDAALAARGATLTLRLSLPPLGAAEEVVIEPSDPALWVSEPRTRREGAALVSTVEIEAPRGVPLALDRAGLRTTVIGTKGAVEIRGCE